MLKFYSLLLIATVSFLPLAYAQEEADDVLKQMELNEDTAVIVEVDVETVETSNQGDIKPLPTDETSYEERLKLSLQMHEIWPIRPKIENALDIVSEQIAAEKRLEFKSGMRRAISFEALEEQSIEAMADIFSVAELNAMINFYGSKEGRSVSYKTTDYEKALLPLMTKMIDKALLDNKLGTPK